MSTKPLSGRDIECRVTYQIFDVVKSQSAFSQIGDGKPRDWSVTDARHRPLAAAVIVTERPHRDEEGCRGCAGAIQ
jgi:hypothetical protein